MISWLMVFIYGALGFAGLPGMPPMVQNPCDTGSARIGTQCGAGGPYYIGALSDATESRRFMITPSGCTDSSSPVCNDTGDLVTKAWGPNGLSQIEGLPDVYARSELGDTAEQDNVTANVGNPAVAFCTNMVFGGYSDWRLPSKTEMAQIYCRWQDDPAQTLDNQPAEGGVVAGGCGGHLGNGTPTVDIAGLNFDTSTPYWVANENMTIFPPASERTKSFTQAFANGGQGTFDRTSLFLIRCVRDF